MNAQNLLGFSRLPTQSIGRLPRNPEPLEGFFLDQAMPSSVLAAHLCPRAGPADDLADVAALLVGGDGVDGVDVRLGRRLDDVGRGRPAAVRAVVALDLQLERDLALRVLALGHAPDDELVQVGADARDPLDGLEDRVDRAVADGRVLDDLAVGAADGDRGRRQDAQPGRRVQADELPVRRDVLQVLLDQDDQVFVVDFLLLVGQRLEVVEQRLELLVGQACSPSRRRARAGRGGRSACPGPGRSAARRRPRAA